MLVADTNQSATSATLGGKEAIAFAISDDPAFFHVLSTSLYNNPTLAVVRETICNSWDAHIEAGKTDTPIRITIDTDNFITFRDFGNGIPDELIGSIYGVYGASTKKSNSSVTGGFGLGCKSPFAYTDSFQVTSWNQGKMSVYNVAKAAIENDGKPGIVPIVTGIPTEESGLEVKFQLGKHDVNTFVHYITSIVFNGEIKAELSIPKLVREETGNSIQQGNYTLLNTLGMSFEPGSYDMSDKWYQGYMGNSTIFVRYGNVMYPIVSSPASEEAVGLILNFMNIIGADNLVVQAAPDTLAIAPSRETLSNQKLTDDGITALCVDLVDRMEKEIKAKIPEAIKQVEEYASQSSTRDWEYPAFLSAVTDRTVQRYMSSSLWAKQRKHHVKHWRNLSNKALLARPEYAGLKKLYSKAMRALKCTREDKTYYQFQDLVYRHLHLPQLAALKATGIKWSGYIMNQGSSVGLVTGKLTDYFKMGYNSHLGIGIFTTKNVVVTRRLSDCADSFSYFPDYTQGDLKRTAFVHVVGPKKGEAEKAVAKFSAMGYRVIDLTQYNEWDKPTNFRREQAKIAAEKRAKTIAANKTKAGGKTNALVSLNAVLGTTPVRDKSGDLVSKPYIDKDFADPRFHEEPRFVEVDLPKYYVPASQVVSGRPATAKIGTMWKWYELSDEMKAETVVCRNQIEVNKAKRRGAIHIDDIRLNELMSVITSKGFKKYATEQRNGVLEYLDLNDKEYCEILDILGLTFKPLQSLVLKPEYEWACDFLRNHSSNKDKLVEMGLIKSVDDLEPYVRMVNPRMHKYFKVLNEYKGLFRYSWNDNDILQSLDLSRLIKHLKKNPEDIPGFKPLYRNRLNKLKGK
ncbi:rIIA-like protein [Escherichia phage vB_EcoP_G7C]|uniref:RIIA-like protein n=1 Tax=Escherichia phage vB_EcoP_G7C TaxID=1054461 RepID=G0XNT2_9CAUD|nr:RIIA lysis inhibitor [Escherichia phage vB_EcoP_G7C]AEL79643.1 rIIA-like protein [Escherichia phage vB_EcoP_G7C]